MNERIRELALQAGLQPFEDCGPGYVYKMEKFAELLVQECANQCNITKENMRGQDPFWEDVANRCREDIKELFRVD